MRKIVSDTGPILHLRETGSLDLLREAGRIFIPPMVDLELLNHISSWKKLKYSWLTIEKLRPEEYSNTSSLIGLGILDAAEAEAIILAQRLKADWLLTDDTAVRIMATSMGLEVHGSLGIILWAAADGFLDYNEAKKTLEKLSRSSLWLSPKILNLSLKALAQIFPSKS